MTAAVYQNKAQISGTLLDGRDLVGRFDARRIDAPTPVVLLEPIEGGCVKQRTRILGRLRGSASPTTTSDSDASRTSITEALIKRAAEAGSAGWRPRAVRSTINAVRRVPVNGTGWSWRRVCDRGATRGRGLRSGAWNRIEANRWYGKSTEPMERIKERRLEGPEGPHVDPEEDRESRRVSDELPTGGVCGSASRSAGGGDLKIGRDATDDHAHGKQEGRFFHGYYKR